MRADHKKKSSGRQRVTPDRLLFPAAALFAALAIPLWLTARTHLGTSDMAGWHGHEMLFGYALAVVAGFLVVHPPRWVTWTLFGTWLLGRAAAFVADGAWAMLAGLSFPLTLLFAAAPPLLRGAKRAENRIVPVVVAALFAADTLWWTGTLWLGSDVRQRALLVALDLLTLLILIVGGRALPAAVGGYLERRGIARRDHHRRAYELPLALMAGAAGVLDGFGLAAGAGLMGVALALLTLVRVIPWQLQRGLAHPQLWALALGYLWLIPGLLLKGLTQITGALAVPDAVHGITIGVIGTVTLVMMARTAVLRARRPLVGFGDVGVAALLLAAAALLRLAAPLATTLQNSLLWLAAAAWSAAFGLLFLRLARRGAHR